jgi:putative molybdopterin biosynthesis protein
MPLVRSDGLLIVPKNREGYEAGEEISVELTQDMSAIENTIVSIGSHDLIMDYLANLLKRNQPEPGKPAYNLSSAHVGSMGGILALSRGEAHLAPIHLLDEATGEYNTSYIERYLNSEEITLVKGVKRQQGFIVEKGNPKGVHSITDLTGKGISFVNRQRGSGTRILTDYLLSKAEINIGSVVGYGREMTTHMAVAAAVKSGTADVGVGVYSAAHAMDLDFIPIGYEEYDFAIPKQYMNTEMIQAFCKVLESDEFNRILQELGGYER